VGLCIVDDAAFPPPIIGIGLQKDLRIFKIPQSPMMASKQKKVKTGKEGNKLGIGRARRKCFPLRDAMKQGVIPDIFYRKSILIFSDGSPLPTAGMTE